MNVAVVVVSFDGYSDIWGTFASLYIKYWPDRMYETYLVTNELEPEFEGINIITTGKEVSWSNRMRIALNQISCDYLILLLEDYLLYQKINNEEVKHVIEMVDDNKIDYLRIAPKPKLRSKEIIEGLLFKIGDQTLYGVNLQAAIWKKDYLLKLCFDDDFSAWEFEARQKYGEPTRILGNCYGTNRFLIPYLNGIVQGKWNQRTITDLKKIGVELPTETRGIIRTKRIEGKFNSFLLSIIPPKVILSMKPLMRKLGIKFVTK